MREENDIRLHLKDFIESRRGIMAVFQPSYQLVVLALKCSLGEGKKDNVVPGFGHPRGEYAIRKRIRDCIVKRDKSISILAVNWQVIISSLEWVVGDSDITPLEARESLFSGVIG